MSQIIIARPAEHMHSKACAISATISVLENWRDDESPLVSDHEVTLALQDNVWFIAREYLAEGGAICQCLPCDKSCCFRVTGEGQNIRYKTDEEYADTLAEAYGAPTSYGDVNYDH